MPDAQDLDRLADDPDYDRDELGERNELPSLALHIYCDTDAGVRCATMAFALSAAMPHSGDVPRLVTVIETEAFARRADKLLSPEERDELVAFLAANPTAGDLIEGTGGVRKVRFAAQGKGKSGGMRVIHYFMPEDGPLYALLLYAKAEQAEMSPAQRKVVASMAAALKDVLKARRR